mmetsp:Transcript_8142/g.13716  ORF Transcript_8142/g.13716 Transcript_8142/m.13716 type:complete len:534 (+) Transcript_8142:84-1685(+)|eukprot:CAMPEP_0175003354 /NCGR_PEP_ID=MMETSP0005-20121125/4180_1 /TAXON_ID=420556 /ORGANISM="Ochromonas sp., Strain CCMP1393" /LENGTH=533 /DNA_ID=CAMNT_0016258417 /DNA_START=56 /DNA_END=1657 /DNA_ORIENTATION=-
MSISQEDSGKIVTLMFSPEAKKFSRSIEKDHDNFPEIDCNYKASYLTMELLRFLYIKAAHEDVKPPRGIKKALEFLRGESEQVAFGYTICRTFAKRPHACVRVDPKDLLLTTPLSRNDNASEKLMEEYRSTFGAPILSYMWNSVVGTGTSTTITARSASSITLSSSSNAVSTSSHMAVANAVEEHESDEDEDDDEQTPKAARKKQRTNRAPISGSSSTSITGPSNVSSRHSAPTQVRAPLPLGVVSPDGAGAPADPASTPVSTPSNLTLLSMVPDTKAGEKELEIDIEQFLPPAGTDWGVGVPAQWQIPCKDVRQREWLRSKVSLDKLVNQYLWMRVPNPNPNPNQANRRSADSDVKSYFIRPDLAVFMREDRRDPLSMSIVMEEYQKDLHYFRDTDVSKVLAYMRSAFVIVPPTPAGAAGASAMGDAGPSVHETEFEMEARPPSSTPRGQAGEALTFILRNWTGAQARIRAVRANRVTDLLTAKIKQHWPIDEKQFHYAVHVSGGIRQREDSIDGRIGDGDEVHLRFRRHGQ